jgi:hypothetical protein
MRHQPEFPSRNGPVKRMVEPVIIAHRNPTNRILYNEVRDANPFFHFFETLWMLNGQDNLDYLVKFNPRMAEYSDDRKLVRGSAYGVRWRSWFGYDQLINIAERLRADPYDRRTVLTMWDAATDLEIESKDVPCNTHCYFSYRPAKDDSAGFLDLTVCNRSNDLIYGCLGSNVFHFSFLLEFMAGMAGLKVGTYYQFTNNLHIYVDNPTAKKCLEQIEVSPDPFVYPETRSIFTEGENPEAWLSDLEFFMRTKSIEDAPYTHDFFEKVAYPLWRAHDVFKSKIKGDFNSFLSCYYAAVRWVNQCADEPMRKACLEWLDRRKEIAERNG